MCIKLNMERGVNLNMKERERKICRVAELQLNSYVLSPELSTSRFLLSLSGWANIQRSPVGRTHLPKQEYYEYKQVPCGAHTFT